ncbi:DUF1963 domain-containing protein [Aestuariispira insulae]|uniref:Uncharacterized protein YwqG n=1 Tax=Aestuariispira insulae TaxID=1461337 RepID=A0A3D9HVY1_9PROT|nr:DUF1963 domain-containing protein [Aestuariispira insulae]RED53627.1 uncharacterized protein YwqG [Aestuariispira insulae]
MRTPKMMSYRYAGFAYYPFGFLAQGYALNGQEGQKVQNSFSGARKSLLSLAITCFFGAFVIGGSRPHLLVAIMILSAALCVMLIVGIDWHNFRITRNALGPMKKKRHSFPYRYAWLRMLENNRRFATSFALMPLAVIAVYVMEWRENMAALSGVDSQGILTAGSYQLYAYLQLGVNVFLAITGAALYFSVKKYRQEMGTWVFASRYQLVPETRELFDEKKYLEERSKPVAPQLLKQQVQEYTAKFTRDCIYFLEKGEGSKETSYLGGKPQLPEGMEWPIDVQSGKAKPFLAQLDLTGFPTVAGLNVPRDGVLFFFLDNIVFDAGMIPHDLNEAKPEFYRADTEKYLAASVLFTPQSAYLADAVERDPMVAVNTDLMWHEIAALKSLPVAEQCLPKAGISMVPGKDLWAPWSAERTDDLNQALRQQTEAHYAEVGVSDYTLQFGGYGTSGQDSAILEKILLLQLAGRDSFLSDELGDCVLQFWIAADDLEQGRFDDVELILISS